MLIKGVMADFDSASSIKKYCALTDFIGHAEAC
jgi:hypothetical protein